MSEPAGCVRGLPLASILLMQTPSLRVTLYLWKSGLFWGKVEYFCMNVSFNLVMLRERYLVTVAIMVHTETQFTKRPSL